MFSMEAVREERDALGFLAKNSPKRLNFCEAKSGARFVDY
jgi:hypothetical protein